MKLILAFFKAVFSLILTILITVGSILFYIDVFSYGRIVGVQSAPEVEVILVLGAAINAKGMPTPVLAERLDYAYELYIAKKAPKILLTGDNGDRYYNEVAAMKKYLLLKGVPEEDMLLDHFGFSTYDSMHRARSIYGIHSMIVCTQEFHTKRSLYLARRQGIDAYGYPAPDRASYDMEKLNTREFAAKFKAFWEREIINRNPRITGEKMLIS